MRIVVGLAHAGCLALQNDRGICFAHEDEGECVGDAGEDEDHPESPPPSDVLTYEAPSNWSDNLNMLGIYVDLTTKDTYRSQNRPKSNHTHDLPALFLDE